jgi:hypothetical protein
VSADDADGTAVARESRTSEPGATPDTSFAEPGARTEGAQL